MKISSHHQQGQQLIPFCGRSMFPLLQNGDQLVVNFFPSPRRPEKSQKGKVCLYHDGQEWVAHRLLQDGKTFHLKGDFAQSLELCTVRELWGEVESVALSTGQKIFLNHSRSYKSLAHFFALQQTRPSVWRRRFFKMALYGLNFLKRFLSKKD